MNWWAVRADLKELNNDVVPFLLRWTQEMGSGKVFEHYWSVSIMSVETEMVNKHGFELYNLLANSGLTADEITVSLKLKFLDMRGLDVVRQLCEGDTHYTIPLGTFQHRKKRAQVGVYVSKEGYRLALVFKDEPTDEEWAQLESALNTKFERHALDN